MAYPAYPPRQQAPYYPPAPQQPPAGHFRMFYADRLRALTFNSRPLIQDLSMTAMAMRNQNDWGGMQTVVDEIEAAVYRAIPTQKLPLLYLLDSISKNIGSPYTTHLLPPVIPRLYIRTYREVDGVTRSKMEEMIRLWRNGGPGGQHLYGPQITEEVENQLFGGPVAPPPRVVVPPVPTVTRQEVLAYIPVVVEHKRRELVARPGDVTLSTQMGALTAIGELVDTSNVAPHELVRIMDQLKAMGPPATPFNAAPGTPTWPGPAPVPTPTLGVPPVAPPASRPPFPPTLPNRWSQPPQRPPFAPTLPISNIPTPPTAISTPPIHGSVTPIPGSVAPTPVPAAAPPIIPVNIAQILQGLTQQGITPGSRPTTPDVPLAEAKATSNVEAYEEKILGMGLKLQSIDLNAVNTLPLDHLPVRCKQCGMRFLAEDESFDAHMDWHFRRNRKERESGGRGAHRRWLPRAEEWITDIEAGPSTLRSPSGTSQPLADVAKVSAERLAQLRQKWVKVPQDSQKKASACPVCKEPFQAELSEEEEEWVWKNALNVNGVYYHATCRAEQVSAQKRLKATDAKKRGTASASPRTTPSLESVKAEPPKRKAEESDVEEGDSKRLKVEEVDTAMEVEVEEAKPSQEGVENGVVAETETKAEETAGEAQETADKAAETEVKTEGVVDGLE
ncbi:hypothetical protein IAT38_004507 [Cryptococcus sp. DSM 104549]